MWLWLMLVLGSSLLGTHEWLEFWWGRSQRISDFQLRLSDMYFSQKYWLVFAQWGDDAEEEAMQVTDKLFKGASLFTRHVS